MQKRNPCCNFASLKINPSTLNPQLKTMNDLIVKRNEEFRRRCLKIFEDDLLAGRIQPLDTVIDRALAMSPCSHYISYDTAARKLYKIRRRGLENEVKEKLARQMWSEIIAQINEFLQIYPKKSFDAALTFVMNYRRPSRFYISRDAARRILRPNVTYSLKRG